MMKRKPDRNEKAVRDAHRNLERLGEQSEKLLGARTTVDSEPEDKVELWGRRIGRGLGYALGAYLLFWFARRYGLL